jgi:hypothetical protein
MKSTNWKDIAELVGIAAIVASLVFVGMQMRQDRIHARAELGAGSFESLASLRLEMTGTEFSATYGKALEHPEQLTIAEKLQINGYLDAVKLLFIRECYLKEREVFTECEVIVHEYGPFFFGNRYAQSWWRLQDPQELTFLPNWVDDEIADIDAGSNLRQLKEVHEGL